VRGHQDIITGFYIPECVTSPGIGTGEFVQDGILWGQQKYHGIGNGLILAGVGNGAGDVVLRFTGEAYE
jgi:hypothetical protein